MNEPVAEYPIDGSRMDRITWIYVRAWPEETERGGASLIPDNHVRAVAGRRPRRRAGGTVRCCEACGTRSRTRSAPATRFFRTPNSRCWLVTSTLVCWRRRRTRATNRDTALTGAPAPRRPKECLTGPA